MSDLPSSKQALSRTHITRVIGRPFAKGNPGRPVGTRNNIATDFLKCLLEDFKLHGASAIEGARLESPLGYCKMIAALLPTKVEVNAQATHISDDELLAIVQQAGLTIDAEAAPEPGAYRDSR